jgi:signal transduction histidine kinase
MRSVRRPNWGLCPAGLALQALRERAEALGATFTASPAAGSGTMVEVVLP